MSYRNILDDIRFLLNNCNKCIKPIWVFLLLLKLTDTDCPVGLTLVLALELPSGMITFPHFGSGLLVSQVGPFGFVENLIFFTFTGLTSLVLMI